MPQEAKKITVQGVMQSVVDRAQNYLNAEFRLDMQVHEFGTGCVDCLELKGLTTIIGMGGKVGLLVAMSFEQPVVDALFTQMTQGMGITEEEADGMKEAVVGEVANTILGHCTSDFGSIDEAISLTPPIIIDQAKSIRRAKHAAFYCKSLSCSLGCIDINLVGPPDVINDILGSGHRVGL